MRREAVTSRIRAFIQNTATAMLAVVLMSSLASAASLEDYHRRLTDARLSAEALINAVAQEEAGSPTKVAEELAMRELQKLLPQKETIEWQGGSVETDNRWLTEALENYGLETDLAKRAVIATEIYERISTIELKTSEIQKATTTGKDTEKQKPGEILRRTEYQKPEAKERSFLQRWIDQIIEWLSRSGPAKDLKDPQGMPGFATALTVILYAVLAALIGFAAFWLIRSLPSRRAKPKRKKKSRVILGERIAADQTYEDLFAQAEQLALDGDLRGAIRKGYIAALCELSDRRVITLASHKTNRDYLRDVRTRAAIYRNMQSVTQTFERHWYGSKKANTAEWEDFRRICREAIGGAAEPVV